MRVPISWLAEFVDLPDTESLAEGLTAQGIKVEMVHRPSAISSVVVARVLNIEPHPNADKLVLVDVDLGGESRRVVCGVQNFEVGDLVPAALPGARLPGLEGELGRREVRGVVSDGMLCSPRELGVSDDHSGILVLPPGSPVGADAGEVLGLTDEVLELDITPNRPDAMSLLGIAREVAAMTGAKVRYPAVPEGSQSHNASVQITVEDPQGCPRYLGWLVEGVRMGPSPDWVQRRLAAAGMRPISGVVDATNYALVVTGQPMHAFDYERLAGPEIVVRRARRDETLVTLDGQELRLDPDDLVIADSTRPVALAGVMGGRDTEVSEGTRRVLLESAYFDPPAVLRSGKRHGLRTEASARFERGADPNAAAWAAAYASGLMAEWAGGTPEAAGVDVKLASFEPRQVRIGTDRANLILGTSLNTGEIAGALERLDFEVDRSDSIVTVTVPTRRPDIAIEEDLVEEVARLIGYERIPSTLPTGRSRRGVPTRDQKVGRRIRQLLVGSGLTEAYTSSFIGPADIEKIGYPADHPYRDPMPLVNAVSQFESLLRPSLLPGLIGAVARNVARRRLLVRFFEVGSCFLRSDQQLPNEPLRLGIVMHGPVPQEWHAAGRDLDYFDLKGVLDVLLDRLRIADPRFEASSEAPFHPGRCAAIFAGEVRLGAVGEIDPRIGRAYDLPHRVLAAELELTPLMEMADPPPVITEPARFPAVLLDLAMSVPEGTPADEVRAIAVRSGGEYLEEVRIFDVYVGEQAGEGRKSVAVSLRFRAPERTLTDEEALQARDAIAAAIAEELGGEIRA